MFVSAVLYGCGSRTALNQRIFLLEVSRDLPRHKTSKDVILDVAQFSIDAAFSTKSFVYRKSQSEYETDFYNQFLIRPEEMITEKTRRWLSESGLFKLVLEPGSYTNATHSLEGNIIALYGDFSNESQPKATMGICFFVVKLSEKSVVFGKTYSAVSDVETRTAEAVIAAFDKCLTTILSDLEKDLENQL
jgi:ABC-type uncharacterized transport system auxiliary subunit